MPRPRKVRVLQLALPGKVVSTLTFLQNKRSCLYFFCIFATFSEYCANYKKPCIVKSLRAFRKFQNSYCQIYLWLLLHTVLPALSQFIKQVTIFCCYYIHYYISKYFSLFLFKVSVTLALNAFRMC